MTSSLIAEQMRKVAIFNVHHQSKSIEQLEVSKDATGAVVYIRNSLLYIRKLCAADGSNGNWTFCSASAKVHSKPPRYDDHSSS